jgi:hypothetical protein
MAPFVRTASPDRARWSGCGGLEARSAFEELQGHWENRQVVCPVHPDWSLELLIALARPDVPDEHVSRPVVVDPLVNAHLDRSDSGAPMPFIAADKLTVLEPGNVGQRRADGPV